MRLQSVTRDELRTIAGEVGELSGWDFSVVRQERDPVPWDYLDVVEQFLKLVPLMGARRSS